MFDVVYRLKDVTDSNTIIKFVYNAKIGKKYREVSMAGREMKNGANV